MNDNKKEVIDSFTQAFINHIIDYITDDFIKALECAIKEIKETENE